MANGNQNQVLTQTDLARINDALGKLDRAKQVIQLAKNAGINVDQLDTDATQRRDQLLKIKNSFFPGQ